MRDAVLILWAVIAVNVGTVIYAWLTLDRLERQMRQRLQPHAPAKTVHAGDGVTWKPAPRYDASDRSDPRD